MPQLGRFDWTVQSTTGAAVSGASVTLYREGATVNGNQSGVSPLAVTVRHAGKIATGDTVFVNATTGTTYAATRTSATVVTLSGFGGTLNVTSGDRITPSTSQPTLYGDDQGGATTSNPLTTSSTGRVNCYMEFGSYDFVVSGAGLTATNFNAEVTPSQAPGQIRYADEFQYGSLSGGIQEAIDDLGSGGGTVHLSGASTYTLTGTTAATASIWLHSNVTLMLNGATIKRGSASLATARSVINACTFGSNGTLPTSAGTLSNIAIIGPGVIDGNNAGVGGNVGSGIEIKFTSDLKMRMLTVQNCLQDGIATDECRNVHINNIHIDTVGQAAPGTSRNGITLGNNSGTFALSSRRACISNVTMFTVGDVAFSTQTNSDVTVNGLSINGAGTAIEMIGNSTGGASSTGISISNVVAENLTSTMIGMPLTGATVYSNVTISNSSFSGTAATHNSGAINVGNDSANSLSHFLFSNCTFTNINTLDTTSRTWVNLHPANPATLDDVRFSNCSFYGKSGSVRTNDFGFNIRESVTNLHLDNVLLKNVAGIGIYIHGTVATASTARALYFSNVTVDTSSSHGVKIDCDSATLTLSEVLFNGCLMKDCGINGSNAAGWYILGTLAGASVSGIAMSRCRALKASGTFMTYGVSIDNTGGATISQITVENSDLRGMQTDLIVVTGTVTNMHFTPLPGRGTDILSAATITIPFDGDVFHVTAANNITNAIAVTPQDNGRIVVLVFDSTPTVTDTGTSVLAGNFIATASDTLTLKCDGTNWLEVARSAN